MHDIVVRYLTSRFCTPVDKLFRYRGYDISYNCTGEVILLRSQQYCNRFLTGHTAVGPTQWTVDARVSQSVAISCINNLLQRVMHYFYKYYYFHFHPLAEVTML